MTFILINPLKDKKGILIIKVTEIKSYNKETINIVSKKFYIGISYNLGNIHLDNVPEWCDFVICQGKINGELKNNIKFATDDFATRNFNPKFFHPRNIKFDKAKKILNKLLKLNKNNYSYNIKNLLKDYEKKKGKIFDCVYISRAEPKRNIPLLIDAFIKSVKINNNIKICLIHTEHNCLGNEKKNRRNIDVKKYFNNIPDKFKKNFVYIYIQDDGSNENTNGSGMFENNGLIPKEIAIFLNLSKTYYFGEEIDISSHYGANRTLCEALCCGLKIVCFKYNREIYACSHKYINDSNSYQFEDLESLTKSLLKINKNQYENIELIKEITEKYTLKKLKDYIKKYFNIDRKFTTYDNLKYKITCHNRDVPWYLSDGSGTSAIKSVKQMNIFLNHIKNI